MRILITGALGHIGSLLIRRLPELIPGTTILMIDNMMTQRYCSLYDLPDIYEYQFVEGDVEHIDFDEYLGDVDVVIHLAAVTDAAASHSNKDLVERINFAATVKLVDACVRYNCRLIFPSTTSVYGSQSEFVDEGCKKNDLKPQSPYAESKLRAEDYIQHAGKTDGLKYVIFRFGTIFGPSVGMRFHTAVNKFIWQACTNQNITVWSTALNQKRPYLDLSDAVLAVAHAIIKDLFDCEIYNVLTLNTSVKSIVDIISAEIDGVAIRFVDECIMNQLSYEVGSSKFMETGFKYSGNLESRLKETIDHFSALVGRRRIVPGIR
jgi:UDP-glucose 4-epimerase